MLSGQQHPAIDFIVSGWHVPDILYIAPPAQQLGQRRFADALDLLTIPAYWR